MARHLPTTLQHLSSAAMFHSQLYQRSLRADFSNRLQSLDLESGRLQRCRQGSTNLLLASGKRVVTSFLACRPFNYQVQSRKRATRMPRAGLRRDRYNPQEGSRKKSGGKLLSETTKRPGRQLLMSETWRVSDEKQQAWRRHSLRRLRPNLASVSLASPLASVDRPGRPRLLIPPLHVNLILDMISDVAARIRSSSVPPHGEEDVVYTENLAYKQVRSGSCIFLQESRD